MADRATDPAYLRYQYGDAEKLRVRVETHERYSERSEPFFTWMLSHIVPGPGVLLDVGCGPGVYHPLLAASGTRVVGVDASPGMARAARDQARRGALPVLVARGDAQRLPIRDASCDRVMANHLLYHVSDQRAALRELRRVVKPGGRVILATNAADSMQRLVDLHRHAARQLGYDVPPAIGARFTLDELPLVRSVFPAVTVHVRDDAFVFPDADAALRYYASGPIDAIDRPPVDGSHRARLLPLVGDQIAAIVAREGSFRVPKRLGCFVAVV